MEHGKITRKQVFEAHPTIRSLIADFQQQFFDPEYNDADDPLYDALHYPTSGEEQYHGNFIAMLPHDDIQHYPKDLATHLRVLLHDLTCTQLIILSFIKTDLFGNARQQDNRLIQARQLLTRYTGSTAYDEALRAGPDHLDDLLYAFFWLSRLDGELSEYIFWADEKQRFCFFICNRGNIHWLSLSSSCDLSEQLLKKHGFVVGPDIDQFSEPNNRLET